MAACIEYYSLPYLQSRRYLSIPLAIYNLQIATPGSQ